MTESLVSLILRPQDKSWIMGEDWEVKVSYFKTLFDVKVLIEEERGICRHRIQLRLKGKVLVPNRENWTLRRTGIYDGYLILVEPTLSGSWLWNHYDYYADKLLAEVKEEIKQTAKQRILLTDLTTKVTPPPCVKTSLRVFLRKYPEQIHIHIDTTNGYVWLETTKHATQLPSYDANPIELGYMEYYTPEPFDWESYADVDDMLKLEVFEPQVATSAAAAEGVDGAAEVATDETGEGIPVEGVEGTDAVQEGAVEGDAGVSGSAKLASAEGAGEGPEAGEEQLEVEAEEGDEEQQEEGQGGDEGLYGE